MDWECCWSKNEITPNECPFIAEGEKDCDNCFRQFGIPATSNSGGAGKWRPEFGDLLKGAQTIAVIADKDEPGRKHVVQVAQSLIGKQRMEVLRLHRLYEFQRVWDLYLQGKTDAAHVTRRARLMLKARLPHLR